jgi:hypothetical protein
VEFRSGFEEEFNVKLYRSKKCGMELPDEAHLKVHEDVHKHALKVHEGHRVW